MARTNQTVKREPIYTHNGARAVHTTPEQQLRRSVMSCLLFENDFYEDGETVAARIARLAHLVSLSDLSSIAIEARTKMHLRHVSLLLARLAANHPERAKNPSIIADTIYGVINRADELAEFVAIYWKDGKKPLSAQIKKGLARAFTKFNEYNFAKYNRDTAVKLRDVLFLCHGKPKDVGGMEPWTKSHRALLDGRQVALTEQEVLYKKIVEGTLETPDTWEVALSDGQDKKAVFERLMVENKLGGLAFLRNLRNMQEAGISKATVADYAKRVNVHQILPFRFMSAAKHVPAWEDEIEEPMLRSARMFEKLRRLQWKIIYPVDQK